MEKRLSKRSLNILLIIALIFFLPVFTGYHFIYGWMYELSFTLFLSVIYVAHLKKAKQAQKTSNYSVLITSTFLVVIGLAIVFQNIFVNRELTNSWQADTYRVDYISERGFAGEPLMVYELYQLSVWELFEKKIALTEEKKSRILDPCIIVFKHINIQFNNCEKKIHFSVKKIGL